MLNAADVAQGAGVLAELDRLVETLAGAGKQMPPVSAGTGAPTRAGAAGAGVGGQVGTFVGGDDAIDQVLADAPRVSGVVSLREAPEVARFRDELTDGLIRVDTANQLLRLINEVVVRLVR